MATGVSCGICCSNNFPCDKCLKQTLAANGLQELNWEDFKGLSQKQSGYQWPWEFSQLNKALNSAIKKTQELILEEKK